MVGTKTARHAVSIEKTLNNQTATGGKTLAPSKLLGAELKRKTA